jgi:hypothetical protein
LVAIEEKVHQTKREVIQLKDTSLYFDIKNHSKTITVYVRPSFVCYALSVYACIAFLPTVFSIQNITSFIVRVFSNAFSGKLILKVYSRWFAKRSTSHLFNSSSHTFLFN